MTDEEKNRFIDEIVKKIGIAEKKLNDVITKANDALTIISSVEKITDTQIIKGETIDNGKMELMHSTCNDVIKEANEVLETCASSKRTLLAQKVPIKSKK